MAPDGRTAVSSGSAQLGTLILLAIAAVAHGQTTPNLIANGVGGTPPYTVYFAADQNTTEIGGRTLPRCIVPDGSGSSLELVNQDNGLVVASTGSFAGLTGVNWNTALHPTLNSTYSGVYVCIVSGSTMSPGTYEMNIIVPLSFTSVPTSTYVYNTTHANQSLTCAVTGYGRTRVSWTSSVTLTSNTTQRTPAASSNGTQQRHVSSTLSFAGNHSGIKLGVPFNITCVTAYTDVVCTSGSDSQASVATNCQTASRSLQSTITVTAQATECPRIIDLRSNTNATSSTPNTVRSVVNLGCMQGYNLTASFSLSSHDVLAVNCLVTGEWDRMPFCNITHCGSPTGSGQGFQNISGSPVGATVNVNCQSGYDTMVAMTTCYPNGSWTSGQYCADIDECSMELLHNCQKATCSNTAPGFFCDCPGQDCTYTECGAVNITGVEIIPRTNVNVTQPIDVPVECMPGFANAGTATITCQRDGNFSATPNCTATDEAASANNTNDDNLPPPDSSDSSNAAAIGSGVAGGVFCAVAIAGAAAYKKNQGDGAKSLAEGSSCPQGTTSEDGVLPATNKHGLAALRQPRPDTRGPPPPDSDPTYTFEPGQRILIGNHSRLVNDPRGGTGSNGDEGHYDALVRDNKAAPQPAPTGDDSAQYNHIVRPVNPESVFLPSMGPNCYYEQTRLPGEQAEPAQQPAPNNPSPGAYAAAEAAEPQPPNAQYAMVDLSKKSRL